VCANRGRIARFECAVFGSERECYLDKVKALCLPTSSACNAALLVMVGLAVDS